MTQQKKDERAAKSAAEPISIAEQTAISGARTRISARHPRLTTRLETDKDGSVVEIGPLHGDRDGWLARLDDLFGSRGRQFPLAQLNHILKFARGSDGKYDEAKANALLAAVDGVRPANEVEAMLALQMAVTHDLAMQALMRAQRVDQIPQYESAGGMAVRLLRTFTAQVEALAKLQRGGEQVVRVVHVHPGGQAVVGNVVTAGAGAIGASENSGSGGRRGGGIDEIRDQPHAKGELPAPNAQSMPPLRSEDEDREAVPLPGGEGQSALPHARRRAG